MAIKTTLENVVPTMDGPAGYECFDAVVTAQDIQQLFKTGFLKVDPDRQRGHDSVTNKPILDAEKIERWAEQLVRDQAYLGQLSWNFRKDETSISYDEGSRALTVGAGAATIPDSAHRHMAIVKAAESADRGSGFDLNRKFSVRIYHVPATEENRIFFAMNQEGQKADPTRSKWLYRVGATRLAAALVENSPLLKENVDTVRDRISKRNPRLCAFNTLSRAFEEYWGDIDPDDKPAFARDVDHMMRYWEKLTEVRPELGKLDLAQRQTIRETSLADSALAITGYVAIARKMRDQEIGFAALERLATRITIGANGEQRNVDYLSRENPLWEQIGVLVPATSRIGKKTLNLRNAKEPRKAMLRALEELVGVSTDSSAGIEPQ